MVVRREPGRDVRVSGFGAKQTSGRLGPNGRFWRIALFLQTAIFRHVAPRHRIRLDCWDEWSVVRGMSNAPEKPNQPRSPEAIAAEIERLADLPTMDLKAVWAAVFGRQPPKGLWRDLLLRMLAWRLQEEAFGGHDKPTLRYLEQFGLKRVGDARCQRLKAGTVLVREFGGARHCVIIAAEGFVWQEKTYSSLSAIARIITGTNWNGPRFFGLREGEGAKRGKRQNGAAA